VVVFDIPVKAGTPADEFFFGCTTLRYIQKQSLAVGFTQDEVKSKAKDHAK
jgi:hypothetical protein